MGTLLHGERQDEALTNRKLSVALKALSALWPGSWLRIERCLLCRACQLWRCCAADHKSRRVRITSARSRSRDLIVEENQHHNARVNNPLLRLVAMIAANRFRRRDAWAPCCQERRACLRCCERTHRMK